MCGFVGVASTRPIDDRDWLPAGCDAIAHRGPDDSGIFWSSDGRIGLGFRRLAIVDLSPAGHQPMLHAGGKTVLTFNGEIYNYNALRDELIELGHNFASTGDSEVLLAAYIQWGADCVERLEGMFAFAIADLERNLVLLARDRVGEKPLFYHLADGVLHFGSELKAMLANDSLPRRIDPKALDCLLGLGHIPGESCILSGFSKLPPGQALTFSLTSGDLHRWQYWVLPPLDSVSYLADATELTQELESLLEASIKRQLAADVPVGVLLSGGLDSSLVVALAARHTSKLRTFTIGFPGAGAYDERGHARTVAEHFATEHIELEATPSAIDIIPDLSRQFDEPILDSSMIPTLLVSRLVRPHCTVALGGDGGDELFGGYEQYSHLQRSHTALSVPLALRSAAAYAAERLMPVGTRGRNYIRNLAYNPTRELPTRGHYFDPTTRRRILGSDWKLEAERVHLERTPIEEDIVQRATRMDFANYLPEDVLVKVDRASMLSSIEMRAPMLDKHLVEFAFSKVPSHLKATTHERKILLRRLAERVLPDNFDRTRKQGFSVPMATWLAEPPFKAMMGDVLLDGKSMFDRKAVEGMLAGQARGRSNAERLFGLLQIELWRRHYGVSL